MRKTLSVILSVLLMATVFILPPASAAVEANDYFEDGSYISVGYGSPEDWESIDGAEDEAVDVFSFIRRLIDFIKDFLVKLFGNGEKEPEIKTASRTKYAAYYDSKGTLLWTVYLTADFTYDGEKAECTDARVRAEIKDSDWKLISAEGERKDNSATGKFTVKQYKLGVPLKEIERKLTLTCDEKGTVK